MNYNDLYLYTFMFVSIVSLHRYMGLFWGLREPRTKVVCFISYCGPPQTILTLPPKSNY